MDWFLYDNNLRHKRVNTIIGLLTLFFGLLLFSFAPAENLLILRKLGCTFLYLTSPHAYFLFLWFEYKFINSDISKTLA